MFLPRVGKDCELGSKGQAIRHHDPQDCPHGPELSTDPQMHTVCAAFTGLCCRSFRCIWNALPLKRRLL